MNTLGPLARAMSLAVMKWMAGLPLSRSDQALVDTALRMNAEEHFIRCHEGSKS